MNPRFLCPTALLLACPLVTQAADGAETCLSVPARVPGAPSGMPSDLDLKASGARVGHIIIRIDEVFESSECLAAPYRFVNSLHVSTQQDTVERQLLFQKGDLYDPRVLAESERLLRSQQYLNEASIQPVGYRDNEVDVLVRVHDVWSLSPGVSFGRKGGENSSRLKFEDSNFLGRGKQASIARTSNVDRTAWRIAYSDPNLLGSRWRMSTAYSSMSDGAERAFALGLPFYSLDTPWSLAVAASDTTSTVSRYSLGSVLERVDMDEQSIALEGGISAGLRDGWVTRYLGGVRSLSRRFSLRPDDLDASVPDDRDLVYPWVGIETIEDEYVRTRNLDQIARTEDVYLGRRARFELGFAVPAFGATRQAVIVGGAVQAGAEPGEEQLWINSLDASGRIEGGSVVNGLLALNSRYYFRHHARRVSFASLTATATADLDPERQLLLGGDNGLRGFPLRYQAGKTSLLATVEERFYTNWQPMKLFDVGAAVFVDAGRTWGHSEPAAVPYGWLANVGMGLRLGNARSGLGNVLHLDVAFPVNGPGDIDSVQLLVETKKSF